MVARAVGKFVRTRTLFIAQETSCYLHYLSKSNLLLLLIIQQCSVRQARSEEGRKVGQGQETSQE